MCCREGSGSIHAPADVCVFQAADEPAYLTVGTEVSAKYRGAFCEAKIKIVKRMVKVKVRLGPTGVDWCNGSLCFSTKDLHVRFIGN